MIIGFTGTRRDPTNAQVVTLEKYVSDLPAGSVLHHGDCVGADALAHSVARNMGLDVVVHPPEDDSHRAGCGTGFGYTTEAPDEHIAILPPKTYFARNRDIVQACERLLAMPCDMAEQPRGGTWYTIRYAWKHSVMVDVIFPDGALCTGWCHLSRGGGK